MEYWLLKTEPETWSWYDQCDQVVTSWDGVRNYQAANNLKAMNVNDLCLFYHSGKERKIMGIVRVIKTYYPDPSDSRGRFGMVDVTYESPLPRPVSLSMVQNSEDLQHLALVRQSRLSVMPIDYQSWHTILTMGQHSL